MSVDLEKKHKMADVLQYPELDYNNIVTETTSKEKVKETDGLSEKKSDIWVRTPDGKLVKAGFKIKQCEYGFRFVGLASDNHIVSDLQLTENDKLLAINYVAVSCWEHDEVVDCLREMFDPKQSRLSIILEREEMTGTDKLTVTTVAIEVDYFISRGGSSSAFALCTKTTVLSKFFGFSAVYCMQYRGTAECLIAIDTQNSQIYLKCGIDGKLTMSALPSRTDKSFHFKRSIFHGFQRHHGENQSCFPCILQSVETGKYVSVQDWLSVGLVKCPVGSEDITLVTSLQRACPRFFFLKLKNVNGKTVFVFESVILKDMYLTWDNSKKKMKLKKIKDSRKMSATLSSLYSTFHLYSL